MMRLMKMHKMAHYLDGKSGSERRQAMSKMANKMGPKAMKMFKKLSWMHQIMHETEDMDKKERKRTVKKLLMKKGKKGKKGGKGKTWFDIMDTNKDGYVTMPEINQFYFDTDMNQNGSVTLNEWIMRFQYSEKMVCKRYESIIDDLIEAA